MGGNVHRVNDLIKLSIINGYKFVCEPVLKDWDYVVNIMHCDIIDMQHVSH